jgi:hypothetical protein
MVKRGRFNEIGTFEPLLMGHAQSPGIGSSTRQPEYRAVSNHIL